MGALYFAIGLFLSLLAPAGADMLGGGSGTIEQLPQFVSTSSPSAAITQQTYGKAFRLSGQSSGCAQFSAIGVLTSSGVACGSGSGGASEDKWATSSDSVSITPNVGQGLIINSASSTFNGLSVTTGTTTHATSTNLQVSNEITTPIVKSSGALALRGASTVSVVGGTGVTLSGPSSSEWGLDSSGRIYLFDNSSTFVAYVNTSDIAVSNKTFSFPNETGTFALGAGSAGNCAEWSTTNTLIAAAAPCGTGSGGGTAFEIATTTNIAVPELAYFTKTAGRTTLGSVATTTLSGANSAITVSNSPVVIGASGAVITCATAGAGQNGCLSSTDWTTFNDSVDTTRTLTVAGTAKQITSSAGAQDLSANRTWTLSLPSFVLFPGDFAGVSASTTNATTTNLDITSKLTFNGVTGTTWASFCTTITGSADLCDGNDASGAGGSAYEVATTSGIAVPEVAYFTKTGGVTTLGSVATGTVSSANTALTVTGSRYVLGGALSLTVSTTTTTMFSGTGGQVLSYTNLGWTGVATTTFTTGLTYAAGNVTVNTSQNILTLSNLTSNGIVTTSGSNGTLGVTANSTGGLVLAMSGGVPTYVATTTFSSGLLYSAGNVTNTGVISGSCSGFSTCSGTNPLAIIGLSSSKWASSTDLLGIYPNGLTNPVVGIGTTTPKFTLQLASSTRSQLSLTDGSLTSYQWGFRNVGGNLYIGTSSPSTFATTTGLVGIFLGATGKVGIGGENATPAKYTFGTGCGSSINTNIMLGACDSSDSRMGAIVGNKGTFLLAGTGTYGGLFAYDYGAAALNLVLNEFGGNVGVSSTSPFAKLSVKGSGTGLTTSLAISNSSELTTFKVQDNGTTTISGVTAATSTMYIYSTAASKGGSIIIEDIDGAGCTEVSALNGVLSAITVTCPVEQ